MHAGTSVRAFACRSTTLTRHETCAGTAFFSPKAGELPCCLSRTPRVNAPRHYYVQPEPPKSATKNAEAVKNDDVLEGRLKGVLGHFNAPVRFAVAYGSGAFPQKDYDPKTPPMTDFIFGVTHPQHWHSLNLTQNRDHYSFYGRFGSRAVTMLQNGIGAGIYYNPYVRFADMEIKYGVTSIERICQDLINWETLYVAGRLHKPVRILRDDARVHIAQKQNLKSALRTALLYLPTDFTEEELFLKIAQISYQGDFRMRYKTENPRKVYNIVRSQMDEFRELYMPSINSIPNVSYIRDGELQQDDSTKGRGQLIQNLPKRLLEGVRSEYERGLLDTGIQGKKDTEGEPSRSQAIAASPDLHRYLDQAIYNITYRPALTQSIKGIITAGLSKSLRYTLEKLKKSGRKMGGK